MPTPSEARSYVVPDGTGTAHGTSGADDIYSTGNNQTLIGGGGNDIFHIGTNSGLNIQESGTGTSTVSTYLSHYTLASGIDNLALNGSYSHIVSGNGLSNYIYGSAGNDTINGGGGDVVIQVGTGSNMLTGGGHHDTFVFPVLADHDNIITDFHAGMDELDLRGLLAGAGYKGTDPLADHVLQIAQQGANTVISIAANGAAHTVVTLDNVVASSLHTGTDYLWH